MKERKKSNGTMRKNKTRRQKGKSAKEENEKQKVSFNEK